MPVFLRLDKRIQKVTVIYPSEQHRGEVLYLIVLHTFKLERNNTLKKERNNDERNMPIFIQNKICISQLCFAQ